MAGVSMTLFWLDDELERLWLASSQSPEYSVGEADSDSEPVNLVGRGSYPAEEGESSEESRRYAALLADALASVSATVDEHMDELGRIDSIAGDGDHGIGMHNGAAAAAQAAKDAVGKGMGAGSLLRLAGHAWSDGGGGTSGALWGLILETLSGTIGDTDGPSSHALRKGVRAACDR